MEISQIIDFYMWSVNSLINKTMALPLVVIGSITLGIFTTAFFHDEKFKYNFLYERVITCWLVAPFIILLIVPVFHIIILTIIGLIAVEIIHNFKKEWSID